MGEDVAVHEIIVSENAIKQPIFHTRKLSTTVTLPDGHAVILGGLMQADLREGEEPEKEPGKKHERHVFFIVQVQVIKADEKGKPKPPD